MSLSLVLLFAVLTGALGWQSANLRRMIVHKAKHQVSMWSAEDFLHTLTGTPLLEGDGFKKIMIGLTQIETNNTDAVVLLIFRYADCRLCLREVAALNGIMKMEPRPFRIAGLCIDCSSANLNSDDLISPMRFPVWRLGDSLRLNGAFRATPYRVYSDSSGHILAVSKLTEKVDSEESILKWVIRTERTK